MLLPTSYYWLFQIKQTLILKSLKLILLLILQYKKNDNALSKHAWNDKYNILVDKKTLLQVGFW